MEMYSLQCLTGVLGHRVIFKQHGRASERKPSEDGDGSRSISRRESGGNYRKSNNGMREMIYGDVKWRAGGGGGR